MEEDGNGRGLGPGSPSASVGQFSFAPATRTTVVTTTTTTTTTFPPVLIRPPRATQDLDPKVYPLASAPTPSALRNIRFELGGKSVVFNEPEDTAGTLNELHEKNDALKSSNGLVRSVASFTSDDTQLSRRLAHRTSNQPSNHLSISKRRLTEAQQGSLRARPARVPSEPSFRSARSHGSTPVHPTVAGLATPETETNSNNAMEGILSRRRIHSASNARRETLLRSPLSSEVESQGPSQTVDARKETLRTNTVMQEHDRQSGCANETAFARPALERTGSDPRQHLTGIAASQDSGYDAPGDGSQNLPAESSSQPFIDNIVAQDMCLPSPSLSPVAALNAANIDSSFDSAEDQEDTDSSFDNGDARFIGPLPVGDTNGEATYVAKSEQLAGPMMQRPTSMMDIPNVLDFFDSVPDGMKTYMMYQFLRRCPKQTLHFVADVVNPALKCDFLSLLPLELSLNIVKYFDVQTMCRAAQVSKKWRHIINSDEKSWKELFDRDGYVLPEGEKEVSASEGPYAAANAAAAAVPYPDIGLPSLRGLHLYKSLYQRHHSIHKAWMKPIVKPRHIAFRAHDRHVVTCLQFDTEKVLTGSDDTNINVYDTRTGELKATLEGHEGGVWALEYYGNTLVSGSTDRSVRVWDIEKARCTQIFHGHTSTVRCLQIVLPVEVGKKADGTPEMMPKEPLIITGSRDSNLRVWKLPKPGDPGYYQSGPHVDDTDCPYFVRVLSGHQHSVRAIAAHGDTLVSGSYDCTVRVWKISTGETVHRLQGHTLKVYSVVLDHKRNRCISGSMDNMVKVWSLETGSILYNLEGHTSLVGLLDLKCDRLVSAAADSTLRIWDPETGQCRNMLSAHTGAITCFQHDGQKVISGSDRTLKMWDVKTGDCVRDLLTDLSGVWQVKFNDRRCVAAVQRDSLTYIEVLDFGASRDGVPSEQLGRRIVVNRWGQEVSDTDEDYDLSDA
ncbi:uncharacterized protein An08g10450 [Aspergillus niger]|uniref:Probable E3 ubiquitin ligase complex SCF subunit sconB n=2 Tax=Aspergillus niger TaxID=5061 RepID=A2QSE6_ASPNC|nr:uncharacterized protein An08g10450 [Aspergillus niger]CAK45718.1 unnamed protein product [Aspergillus niger]